MEKEEKRERGKKAGAEESGDGESWGAVGSVEGGAGTSDEGKRERERKRKRSERFCG